MKHSIITPLQLSAVIRSMRLAHGLTQAQVGAMLGVNQRRTARIESKPDVTSFGQISQLVSALGGRIVIETPDAPTQKSAGQKRKTYRPKIRTTDTSDNNW